MIEREREACGRPRARAAVEDTHAGVIEKLEEPEGPGRTRARRLVVDDDGTIGGDAALGKQVLDDPEERPEGGGVGVDEADAPQIQVHGAWQMTGGVLLGGTEVEQ
jgi:hypothetical protein